MSKDQTTALSTTKDLGVLTSAVKEWGEGRIKVLKNSLCSDLNNGQMALFLEVCSRKKLDPFARQIHAVTRNAKENINNQWVWVKKMTIQTGIDGFRTLAQRTGVYRGQLGPFWCGEDGIWTDVWLQKEAPRAARIGVLRSDFDKPLYAVALYSEYVQTKKNGDTNSMWQKFPTVMLAKCAESIALRRAFPEELSGLYSSEEMGQAEDVNPQQSLSDDDVVSVEVVQNMEPQAVVRPEVIDEETESNLIAEFARLNLGDDTVIATIGRHLGLKKGDFIPDVNQLHQNEAESLLARLQKAEPKGREEGVTADDASLDMNLMETLQKIAKEIPPEKRDASVAVMAACTLQELSDALDRYVDPRRGRWTSVVWNLFNDYAKSVAPLPATSSAQPSEAESAKGVDGPETMRAHLNMPPAASKKSPGSSEAHPEVLDAE